MPKISRILIDIDCVLADFVGGLATVWGLSREELLREWTLGEYRSNAAVSRAMARQFPDPCPVEYRTPVSDDQYWKAIEDRTPGFWENLEPLPWMSELMELIIDIKGIEWRIVSAPSRCLHCVPEKRRWLHKHVTPGLDSKTADVYWHKMLIPTSEKHLMGKPGVLLIDDSFDNCHAFTQEGGNAILFPAHHNPLHGQKDDPMKFVRRRLSEFLG